MSNLHEIVVATVAFFVLVGLMVIVHELGHFIVAKLCKVRVEAFSFGFGPRLFGFKYGETDYKVCLLPLGGFVKMTGENPGEGPEALVPASTTLAKVTGEDPGEDAAVAGVYDPAAFSSHPRWQRMLIGVAGPISNFILAFVLMVFYFVAINEVPYVKTTTLEWVSPSSQAAQAGLAAGDVVTRFGNTDNPDFETFVDLAKSSPNQTVPIVVSRNGQSLPLSLSLPSGITTRGYDLSAAGLYLQIVQDPLQVDQVVQGAPAEIAGLRAGDTIVAVDGHPFHTVDPLLDYLQAGKGNPITLTVKRNDVLISPIVVHPAAQDSQYRIGFAAVPPVEPPTHDKPMSLFAAMDNSAYLCKANSTLIIETITKIFSHKVSVKQLSGPIGIARMAGQAAEMQDWFTKFNFAAAISLNLGILNLLPFPILDGGMILFLLIESVLRHDINMMVKERIYQAAFVLILVFFAFVMFNDITKLPIFTHLKP
jgi:regulator of sigma E protease